jgi:ABC-type cobalamin transport system ATPase subunit
MGGRKKRAKQQKKIASPEPTYIESQYKLNQKECIKQNKERLKSLGLDLSIGELAKKMNANVVGGEWKRVGRGTIKYRVIAQIQRGKLQSKQSLKLIKL